MNNFDWNFGLPPRSNLPIPPRPSKSYLARPALIVARDQRPLYQQKGWSETRSLGFLLGSKTEYRGYYRTRLGSYKGKALKTPSGRVEFYIENPPMYALKNHKHGPCFMKQPMDGNWHLVHKHNTNCDLGSGIISIENILYEALSSRTGI